MKSVAILPLRAGSKGIPNKNKLKILGRPLFSWVLTEAIFSNLSEIYVFTDDDDIIEFINKEYTWTSKVIIAKRSKESASDTASTEMAMVELADKINYDFDLFCLLQATSPLTNRSDINKALTIIEDGEFDSTLSVVETKRFIWNTDGESLNYNYLSRPRRQDFEGMLMENGAIYVSTKKQFKESNNRIGGQIKPFLMAEDSLVEIDEKTDLFLIRELIFQKLIGNKGKPSAIKYFCLDVDGVFTDATINVSLAGEFSKQFSYRDGMGLALLRDSGVQVMVITSEDSKIVMKRMEKLGIQDIFMGVKDKYSYLDQVCYLKGINRTEIAYIGDDINDIANLASCGLSLCPSDAEPEVQSSCDIVLGQKGGERVIREACELIMKHNNRF